MSDENKPADLLAQWTETWRSMAGSSTEMGEVWSKSVLPFILARATESKSGMGAGNELADAIERMAQGPRLADVVDFDRKLLGTFSAWTEMQKKLAAYNAVASRPWMKAAEKYQSTGGAADKIVSDENWRSLLGSWTALANDELLANQRTDEFLRVQRELMQAATEFRARQIDVSETVSKIMGLPTQSDSDDVTRQLTELRREVRALTRRVDKAADAGRASAPSAKSDPPAAAPSAPASENGALP
jgi:polyhydroxyalkanoate synthase subunit PhaE